jgi:hypothetical protein
VGYALCGFSCSHFGRRYAEANSSSARKAHSVIRAGNSICRCWQHWLLGERPMLRLNMSIGADPHLQEAASPQLVVVRSFLR